MLRLLMLIAAPVLAASTLPAQTTWYVDITNSQGPWNGSQSNPFCKIQDAINAASNPGDIVLVASGTYVENIDFQGKAIAVRSSDGPAVTTIDGNGGISPVVFIRGEDRNSLLEGFTITNGTGSPVTTSSRTRIAGGGILCKGSSPTIRGNIVTGNAISAGGYLSGGGGIACLDRSDPLIVGNEVHGNSVTSNSSGGGGGIVSFMNSAPVITENAIHDNSAVGLGTWGGGGISSNGGAATITRNSIYRNTCKWGAGIQILFGSVATVANNAIFDNTATESGGGIDCFQLSNPVHLANNTIYGNNALNFGGGMRCWACANVSTSDTIFWNNTALSGNELSLLSSSTLSILYSNVQGGQNPGAVHVQSGSTLNWGAGMINGSPMCGNPASGNFALQPGSPCIDAGDPASSACCEMDLDGNPRVLDGRLRGSMRIDMGACEVNNVHLVISGSATPGGTLTITTTGTAGLALLLFVGTSPGVSCIQPFGCLFIGFSAPWVTIPAGTIPISFPATLRAWMQTPQLLIIQGIGIHPGTPAGNFSNPVELVIE